MTTTQKQRDYFNLYYSTHPEYRERKKRLAKEWATKNKDKVKSYYKYKQATPERLKQKAAAQDRYRKKMKALGLYDNNKYRGSREKRTLQNRRWLAKQENKIKKKAHMAVFNAIKSGVLSKHSCEVCNKEKAMAHHDDYSKPLSVRWLCALHHYEHHKNNP